MTKARIVTAAVVAFCAMGFGSALGQQAPPPQQCRPVASALAGLLAQYGEQPLWIGALASGEKLVIIANPDKSTWTALRLVGGMLCPISSGDTWSLRDILPGAPA